MRPECADAAFDTNVLVAALRSRRGVSWRILDLVRREQVLLIREWVAKARFRLKPHTVPEISDLLRLGREMFTYLCTDQ